MNDSFPGEFVEDFNQAFRGVGRRHTITPDGALRLWSYFADDCVEGYPWEVDYYANDLTLRDAFEKVLENLRAGHPKESRVFVDRLSGIDERVKSVLSRESFPQFPADQWWNRNTPVYASRDFCVEMKRAYGVDVQPRSSYDDESAEMRRMREEGRGRASICVHVKAEMWKVASRPSLIHLAGCKAFPLERAERRLMWAWTLGEVSDEELIAALD